ncbi:symplekin [Eurytemora carolleeae]|uniref:symplekin n=1 Tax=Eurytemora carolleeae TaxID=1294199 RepID=UPI000C78380B|nr:symplekin [Eurytemora carolleeae]|eukprot:XP_023330368.1 symplekin-like [Eurytemora affinis]
MSLSQASGGQQTSSSAQVIELLNNAQMNTGDNSKLDSLKIVQEIVVHKEPDLLDNFLDEILAFQTDRNQEVRKFVVAFIEEACKKDAEILPKVITNLQMMLGDDSVAVQKRVIQAMTHLYRSTLRWMSGGQSISDRMEAAWGLMVNIKDLIVELLDSDNDGIRTLTLKFMEMIVLTQTHREPESAVKENDFCLDDIPLGLKQARPRKLEVDARRVFDDMVKYHGSAHISSANLMTCMGALSNIAKLRPEFMAKVITALEMLHANLPPTLAKSQVSSVRKHLKNQLLTLLKHPFAAEQFFTNITTLLTDLGASRDEVMKAMPHYEEMKRKARKKEREAAKAAARAEEEATEAKRQKIDIADDEEDDEDDEEDETVSRVPRRSFDRMESAVDITEKFVFERLKEPSFAAELVMLSMQFLPREIPPHFNNTYTPIAAAGTETQVRHVSRLLAAQLTNVGLGPGVRFAEEQRQRKLALGAQEEEDIGATNIPNLGEDEDLAKVKLTPTGLTHRSGRKGHTLKLSEVTKPLSESTKKIMILDAVQRILKCEKAASVGGVTDVRIKIITSLAASFSHEVRGILLDFIFEDLLNRADLAFNWLYEEYCFCQGFNRSSNIYKRKPGDDNTYNEILCSLINGLNTRTEILPSDRDSILRRLYLESPIITSEAIGLLKQFCQEPGRALSGVSLMKDLVLKRPVKQLNFLNSILEFCSHEENEVRDTALSTVLSLYERGELASIIEDYSGMFLRFLLLPRPPDMLFGEDRGRPIMMNEWTEDFIKVCLNLFLALLPKCKKLLTNLAEVYVSTSGDIKRTILRIIETPIREIGMESPELLSLVENCPKGSETLITRIIHILTEKATPSPELVNKVRELYAHRVADVRFLIPVLNGLSRQEVTAALPKLIKLNPGVVKEVFNRLIGITTNRASGAMSPAELLIALHNIDPTKCDTKTVMKATSYCFQEKSVYTMEVLTIVLQQLMEQKDIPLLLMRSVLQSVSLYPPLIGFTMNILQRLIVKKVWKQRTLWDGFIRCCQKTKPQSYTIMLQLPPRQLSQLLKEAEDLRDPLLVHVQNFTDAQRQHVPATIMAVLYNSEPEPEPEPEQEEETI